MAHKVLTDIWVVALQTVTNTLHVSVIRQPTPPEITTSVKALIVLKAPE